MPSRLSYDLRFVSGKIIAIHPLAIDVELDRALNGIGEVRIQHTHWPKPHPVWHVGMGIDKLFIYDLSAAGKAQVRGGHWFGSLLWLSDDSNPWHRHHPSRPKQGEMLAGEIINLAGSHAGNYRAVVVLKASGIEAYLPLPEVPNPYSKTVSELFPIGLRVQAKVKEVDYERCEVYLSVLERIRDLAKEQGNAPHVFVGGHETRAHEVTSYLRFVDAAAQLPILPAENNVPLIPWQGFGICIIDDDKHFGHNLCRWFQQLGAKAWSSDNPEHARNLFFAHAKEITHILVDHDLGDREQKDKFWKIIRPWQVGRNIAIISGLPELDASIFAKKHGFSFFAKPISYVAMQQWLLEKKAPEWDPASRRPAKYWNPNGGAFQPQLQQEAERWLTAVCQCGNAVTAIWVRCFHPGYMFVAATGLAYSMNDPVIQTIQQRLQQSIVQDVALTGKAHRQTIPSGPLELIWPSGVQSLLAEPLQSHEVYDESDTQPVDDILLVFGFQPVPLVDDGKPRILRDWWKSLLVLEQTEARLVEDATFATQGRVHSATLHELRPHMQVFEDQTPWDEKTAQQWWASGKKVRSLIDSSLYNIRPERNERINLYERMYTLMNTFLWQLISRRQISVVVFLPPKDLEMMAPPEAIEQPLINMIDNATKFCEGRRWAKVEVRAFLDINDLHHPVVIQVRDQGQGMTPNEERHLFQPRHTASGNKGFGIGLYVSHSLAKAVGGALQTRENHRWLGCTFELRLPLYWNGSSKEQ